MGVVDTDIQSPGIHVLFGLEEDDMGHSLNDYLWGKCNVEEAAHDVTAGLGPGISGQVFLIPSSIKAGEIARVLREGYDVGLLNDGFHELVEALDLDVLLIDTHPGLNEETLLSIAISDALAIIMRPDQQDYQGTGVTVEVARKLNVPRLVIIVNKTPQVYDFNQVQQQVETLYNAEVAAVMPHSDEMMALASAGVFSMKFPGNQITQLYQQVADRLMA
ncbi:MAG: MinD/ParA family protein [Anaerolineae bacterium]